MRAELVGEVKNICSYFLNASGRDYDIQFTSNTTESVNILANGLHLGGEGISPVVITTIAEHSSNDIPWRLMAGSEVQRTPLNDEGFIDENNLEDLLKSYNEKKEHGNKRIKLISVFGASNVLGTCNNLKAISDIAHKYGALLFVDAAQLVAHRKINMEVEGIDFLAFSAHKIYAPFGTGVLVSRKGMLNFTDEEKITIEKSGSLNIGGIASLGKALHILQRIGMDVIEQEEQDLTKYALLELSKLEDLKMFGLQNYKSPAIKDKLGVFAIQYKDLMADKVAKKLSQRGGMGVRAGCHCSHLIVKDLLNVGPKLEKFQRIVARNFPSTKFPGLTRISLGIENNKDDIDRLIDIFKAWDSKLHSQPKSIENQIKDFIKEREKLVFGELN